MGQRKDTLSWVLIIGALLLVGAAAMYALWPQLQPHTTLRIGDGVFTARVVSKSADLQKGLSGTAELKSDQAMLFVYDRDDKWSMWMKDMKYPIDIVWLDKNKKVVYIVKNASPDSYPDERFVPKQDARFVIELPAGTVASKSISVDSQAMFDEHNLKGWNL